MTYRFYPAVLEKGDGGAYGVWFPNFPNAVAAARDHEEAMARAEEVLAQAVEALVDLNQALPDPVPFDQVVIPSGCKLVAVFAVRVTPPDISERVNIYLPKTMLERVDRAAEAAGMSRSGFFRVAISAALRAPTLWAGYQQTSKDPQKP